MAIRTREEIMSSVRERFGEDTSDETLVLIEDISDTMTDLETKANNDNTNWKQKYEENDAQWRQKYRDRFFSADSDDLGGNEPPAPQKKSYTYENLFKEG